MDGSDSEFSEQNKKGEVKRFMQLRYQQMLGSSYLKPQTIHTRPMRSPTIIKETTVIMMFWKKVKSMDQKRVNKRMKMSQPINASIDIAIGMVGFLSFIVTQSVMKVYNCWDGSARTHGSASFS